jgi:hypothetical protein
MVSSRFNIVNQYIIWEEGEKGEALTPSNGVPLVSQFINRIA